MPPEARPHPSLPADALEVGKLASLLHGLPSPDRKQDPVMAVIAVTSDKQKW